MTEPLLKVEENTVTETTALDIIIDSAKLLQNHCLAINDTIKVFLEDLSSKEDFAKKLESHDEDAITTLFCQIVALNSIDKAFDIDKQLIRSMLKAYNMITHNTQIEAEANNDN